MRASWVQSREECEFFCELLNLMNESSARPGRRRSASFHCGQCLTPLRSATVVRRSRQLVDVIVRHECWRLRKEAWHVGRLEVGR